MENPTGKIHSLIASNDGVRAVVDVDMSTACPRCASGRGCGAGLFAAGNRQSRVEAIVTGQIALEEGDSVEISLASQDLLKAALIVYGMPLFGALVVAGLAYLLQMGDSAAAVAAVIGMLGGLLYGRWHLSRNECFESFLPCVERRLHGPQSGS